MALMTSGNMTRPGRTIATVRRRWYVVVLAGIVGGVGAFALSAAASPVFHSHASLYFSLRSGASGSDINQGSTYTQNQMLSFAQLASSAIVLDRVAADVGQDVTESDLQRMITVTTPQNTVVLEIGADTHDPVLSARIANSVAQNVSDVVTTIAPVDSANKSTVTAHVIEPAVAAEHQSSPNKQQNALLGAFLGIALAILGIFIAVICDTKVRSVSALKSVTNRPLLGVAEQTKASLDARPVVIRSPNGSAAERFRSIRAGLQFAAASHEARTIAVTSSVPGEGKSMTALNLAIIMAETKDRVLLVDADLRRPRLADYLGFEGAVGLTTVLTGDVTLSEAVQRLTGTTLDVLTAGVVPPNPAELLATASMREVIAEAQEKYDYVIIDTAPLLSVADAAVIAHQADSTVVVADSSKVRQAQLEQSLDALDRTGAYVAGIVLNRVKSRRQHDDYYREVQPRSTLERGRHESARPDSPVGESLHTSAKTRTILREALRRFPRTSPLAGSGRPKAGRVAE